MWTKLRCAAARLYEDQEGATMAEYALMASLIAAVCVLVVTAIGLKVAGLFKTADANYP